MSSLSNTSYNSRSMNGLINVNANTGTFTDLEVNNLIVNQSGTAPTMPTNDNSTAIATTAFVQSHTSGNYVDLTGTQTITGQKTFSNANTYVTGNLVTNSIQADAPTNNINIGTQLTTGDVNIGTTSSTGQNVALNWGTTSNSGQLTFRGGSFTLSSTGNYTQQSGGSLTTSIDNNKTTGTFNMLTGSTWSGTANIGSNATATGTFNIGASGTNTYLNGTNTINTIKGKYIDLFAGQLRMFSGSGGGSSISLYVPPSGRTIMDFSSTDCDMVGQYNLTSNNITCSIAPTTNYEYVNKLYVDNEISGGLSGYMNLTTAQTANGDKTFNGITTFDNAVIANFQITNNDVASFQNGAFFDNVCPYSTVVATGSQDLVTKGFTETATQTITGAKTFNNIAINQNAGSDINMTINTVGSDNFYFNFSTLAQLRLHYVNALNKINVDVPTAGKKLGFNLAGTEYLRLDSALTGGAGVLVNKLTTGVMDYQANNININTASVDMNLSLQGTNYITLNATTSKVTLAPTRCASYLEVVGEIQANNPIEVTYNPSSISAGRIGYQNITAISTTPVSNGSAWTNVQSVSLSAGVWNIEGTSYYATNISNAFRGISLTTTSGSYDTSRWIRTQSTGGDFFSNRITSIFSLTATTTVYLTGYASAGSITGSQHTIRYTRIA